MTTQEKVSGNTFHKADQRSKPFHTDSPILKSTLPTHYLCRNTSQNGIFDENDFTRLLYSQNALVLISQVPCVHCNVCLSQ